MAEDYGVDIIGEWKLTDTVDFPPYNLSSTKSIFFRQDHTFSSQSDPASPSEGKWMKLGNMVIWQDPMPNTSGWPAPVPFFPNTHMGNKIGRVMMGLSYKYERPDMGMYMFGFWNATKV